MKSGSKLAPFLGSTKAKDIAGGGVAGSTIAALENEDAPLPAALAGGIAAGAAASKGIANTSQYLKDNKTVEKALEKLLQQSDNSTAKVLADG